MKEKKIFLLLSEFQILKIYLISLFCLFIMTYFSFFYELKKVLHFLDKSPYNNIYNISTCSNFYNIST